MNEFVKCRLDRVRVLFIEALFSKHMHLSVALIAKGGKVVQGIVPDAFGNALASAINMVKMKCFFRPAADALTPVALMRVNPVPAIVVILFCCFSVRIGLYCVTGNPAFSDLGVELLLAICAPVLCRSHEGKCGGAVGAFNCASDSPDPFFLSVSSKPKNIVHSSILWLAGIAYTMVGAAHLERLSAYLARKLRVIFHNVSISIPNYTLERNAYV